MYRGSFGSHLPWVTSAPGLSVQPFFYSPFVSSVPPPRSRFFLSLTLALAFPFFICQTSGMDDGELCVA